MQIITFLTDFGTKDGYISQMKAIASKITDARLVDITHDISPHNIREGAYNLRCSAPFFPIGTVHVAVVDPGVGTDRRGLIITTKKQILVGPDNGLLMPAAHYLGNFIVYEIRNEKYMLDAVSSTFHGRDIFSPVASHITNGIPFDEIGNKIDDYVDLDFGKGVVSDNTGIARVIYIDRFGNIITNLEKKLLLEKLEFNKNLMLFVGKKYIKVPFVKSYGFVKKNEVLATIGSGDLLEIGLNQGNAAKKLGIKIDDKIDFLLG
jgi:S-adenosylmethionine hydrolase